ncbi:hypothetical protein GCK32_012100, partial [Trichostrongylus colubriformis]
VCYANLKLTEQQMRCSCGYVYCKEHQSPNSHLCHIDQKQKERTKLHRENPKVGGRGAHKLLL